MLLLPAHFSQVSPASQEKLLEGEPPTTLSLVEFATPCSHFPAAGAPRPMGYKMQWRKNESLFSSIAFPLG